MKLQDQFNSKDLTISFELFPPKTEKGEKNLYKHVDALMQYSPAFVTCTYGAGGSTQSKTLEIVDNVKKKFDVPVASHLTLVGSTVDELRTYLNTAKDQGVDYIVALRGDPPHGETEFTQTQGGYRYANELVELIAAEYQDFGVIVAGYPETHREAPSPSADLDNLKRKVDAGADVIVTQLFYDNDDFFKFRDECNARGINVPIIPGLLPVTSLSQIQRITSLCGAKLPDQFIQDLTNNEDNQFQVGVDQAVKQIENLILGGVDGLHLYVLNRSNATIEIMKSLNLPV